MRIYEINTWLWLSDLSARYQRPVTLDTVPDTEWDALEAFHFDAVWLMGIWQRSPWGREIARSDPMVLAHCRSVSPGFTPEDVECSPYCIADYVVDARLGGRAGLVRARQELARRKLKLILDFVPNHTAPDHPWTTLHPEFYVQGQAEELMHEPHRFFRSGGNAVLARGALSRSASEVWNDTAQLNAFHPGYRDAAVAILAEIAQQCDGVRCDMAMLMLSSIFATNWRLSSAPSAEFWTEIIGRIRSLHPEFLWIAESYSDTEWSLQRLGFDYCYDKDRLYERLSRGDAESVRQHLQRSDLNYLKQLIHFLENHDEPPVCECFRPAGRHRLAALVSATLPGASLWYDRQFEGRWGKLPVQLGRHLSVREFYQRLLTVTDRSSIRQGEWAWCPAEANSTLLAWCWCKDDDRTLVVVNMSPDEAWDRIKIPWEDLRGRRWVFRDLFSGETYGPRDGDAILESGLVVGRLGWAVHLFEVLPAPSPERAT